MNTAEIAEVVRREVNEADPERLLKLGCPADEYDLEIAAIVEAIEQHMGIGGKMPIPDARETWIIICNVMHRFFGMASEPVSYWDGHKELAAKIHHGLWRKQ